MKLPLPCLLLVSLLAAGPAAACSKQAVPAGEICFEVDDGLEMTVTRADVTMATLQSSGFNTYAYRGRSEVFNRSVANYDAGSGCFKLSNKYWPASGTGYSFVATSRNLPYDLYNEGDVDGDGRLDYCFDVYDAENELINDVVAASNSGSYTSGTVPLSFRHVYSKLSGIYVKAQNVSGATVCLKQLEISLPGSARMHMLSRDGLRWEINECAVAGDDTLAIDDGVVEDVAPLSKAANPESALEMNFENYFPRRTIYSGSLDAGPSSEQSLGIMSRYLIPTNCIKQDGAVFQSDVVPMKLTVVYDVYLGGILAEPDKMREERLAFSRGSNYVLHLVLPVQAASGLSVGVDIVDWQSGTTYSETM